jgi:hypothetical protein
VKVYNLTDRTIDYRGRLIPANGGWVEMPELTYIPDRDLRLAEARYLAFGSLPDWWHPPNLIPVERITLKVSDDVKVEDAVEVKSKKR